MDMPGDYPPEIIIAMVILFFVLMIPTVPENPDDKDKPW